MATLDQIRAKLKAMENRQNSQQFSGTSINYPFWEIDEGSSAVVRFLPDADEDNVFFWRERQVINLPFPGVVGGDESREVKVRVPCVETWGDSCPILAQVRPWWQDKSLEDEARKYWKKRSYLFQGLILEDPLNEKYEDPNPIRKLTIGPQIFNLIKDALNDPDLETSPVDFVNGLDFRINVTKKGKYRDYSTSKWARRETALTEEQLAEVEKHGLFNLDDWMPARPSQEHLAAMVEMFEASVNGELYDPEKWARFYKPFGVQFDDKGGDSNNDEDKQPTTKAAPKAEEPKADPAPAAEPEVEEPKASSPAQDILAKIRQRAQ